MPQQFPATIGRFGLARGEPVNAVILGHAHQRRTKHQGQHVHLAEHQHGHRQRHATADQQRGGHQQDRAQRAECQPHQQQHRRQRPPTDGVDLLVGLHRGGLGMQRHAGMQDFKLRRRRRGGLPGTFQQAIEVALAIQLERRAGRIELQHGPMPALGFKQAVIAQPQARTLRLLLPPLRPQRQRILAPFSQSRRTHRAIQRSQRLLGQHARFAAQQLLALGRCQQAVAVRRVERARLVKPAFDRAAGYQQGMVGILGHGRRKGHLRALGSRAVLAAEQHHDLPRTAIGNAPGDVAQQAVVRILRQQGEDVGVDPRLLAPQLPLLCAQRQQHQQPGNAQPVPPAPQPVRCVRCHGLTQSGGPRRH